MDPLAIARTGMARLQAWNRPAPAAPAARALSAVGAVGAAALSLPPGVYRQPDSTTCGSASVVMAHRLVNPSAPAGDFAPEVLATHERTNAWRDPRGRRQLPWPRRYGTQPWAIAHELGRDGVPYRVRFDDPTRRPADFDEVVTAVRGNHPVALFIGNTIAPRHVVLAFAAAEGGTTLQVYDPSSGGPVSVDRGAYLESRLRVAGWDEPWLAVLPN